jgi:protein TonB
MKFKYFALSLLFHIIILFGFFNILPNPKDKNRGMESQRISVNLTMSNPGNSNVTVKKQTKKHSITKNKKIKKQEVKKKKIEPQKKRKSEEVIVKKEIKKNDTSAKITHQLPKIEELQKIDESPKQKSSDILGDRENDKNLVKIKNGEYALKNQKISGINIVINKEIAPTYPELALKMGYRKDTVVKVKFLVGKTGFVEDIKFYTKSKYGFEVEVEKALKQWKFDPIIYKGTPTPTYFYKVFNFVAK